MRWLTAGALTLAACSEPESCWTSERVAWPAEFAEGRLQVVVDGPAQTACTGRIETTLGEKFNLAALSNAPDPASGPWRLLFSAGPPDDGALPPAMVPTEVDVEVADIAGPGDTVLEAGQVTLDLVCSPPAVEAPPLTLTGTLHLDRISAECNDAQSRFGRQAHCALDAAGTLTVEGVDAEGSTRLRVTATFDLVQRLECPRKIAVPTDHK